LRERACLMTTDIEHPVTRAFRTNSTRRNVCWRTFSRKWIALSKRHRMKTIVIGVMPQKQIRARMIAIAKGEYKPKAGEPKIWFTSMRSVAEVLSDQNRSLLKVIRDTNPESVSVLAKTTGRQPGNLSRTLKTMSRYGLVDLRREKSHVRPIVKATGFRILAAA
jgi:predicted transcriptional regulator